MKARDFARDDVTDEDLMDVFRMYYNTPEGRQAYDTLDRRWRPRIFAHHLAMMRNNATVADELTQQTFCRLIDKRDLFDRSRGTFGVWLYKLAANLKHDFGRAIRRAVTVALDAILETMGEPSPVELRILVTECLDELDYLDRQIILLTAIEGFTTAEASRILNLPPGTLGRRRASSLRRLQAAFERSASYHKPNQEKGEH